MDLAIPEYHGLLWWKILRRRQRIAICHRLKSIIHQRPVAVMGGFPKIVYMINRLVEMIGVNPIVWRLIIFGRWDRVIITIEILISHRRILIKRWLPSSSRTLLSRVPDFLD
jgi:hypothetical protein